MSDHFFKPNKSWQFKSFWGLVGDALRCDGAVSISVRLIYEHQIQTSERQTLIVSCGAFFIEVNGRSVLFLKPMRMAASGESGQLSFLNLLDA